METWRRLLVVGIVLGLDGGCRDVARPALMGDRSPEALTRYRLLRRTLVAATVFVGVLALLVVPQVRAVAGLRSAVIGVIIGFGSQRTLGNFVAGVMIAITQPLRLGDWVEVAGVGGTVEEIGLTYTYIRTADNARFVIPNEKLASDTIRNPRFAALRSTPRSRSTFHLQPTRARRRPPFRGAR